MFTFPPAQHIKVTYFRLFSSINMNRKPDIGVHADPASFLLALGTTFTYKADPEWLEALRKREEAREQAIMKLAQVQPNSPLDRCRILADHLVAKDTCVISHFFYVAFTLHFLRTDCYRIDSRPVLGINPIALLREVDRAIAADSVIVVDGGDFVATAGA